MDECSGAIILGYPQIGVERGSLKGKLIPKPGDEDFLLATEWNHIEAGLAYARGLPLLVIHHAGVRRGIFDRGATNRFIYKHDLSDPAWPLARDISGAFTKWKKELADPPKQEDEIYRDSSNSELVEAHGVLWRRIPEGVERIAYCPSCRLAMSVFPPGSNEMILCSKCKFVAPFRPEELIGNAKSVQ